MRKLAVGKPMVLPSFCPSVTIPESMYGLPSRVFASVNCLFDIALRILVLLIAMASISEAGISCT